MSLCNSAAFRDLLCRRRRAWYSGANGSGWQLGIGRIGGIIGPLLGALFVGLPVPQLYMWSAVPVAIGAVVTFNVHMLNKLTQTGVNDSHFGTLIHSLAIFQSPSKYSSRHINFDVLISNTRLPKSVPRA
jgi:hypothetical protein